ncbi:MAG: histidine--tRNA ligase [Burkholderiaceae bacterium]|nr:histidine--tRNA ligase [Burkholderiaceae bacterium]
MAKDKIQAVKGMNDILPQDDPMWDFLFNALESVAHRYGYMQIRTPILEQTRLFKRGIGEVTDIVEKEMYSFVDSLNGEELTLRPENTASVVRAVIEHNLTYEAPRRLWYFGPMFRHERPQRGRYRQFYQFGMEAIGFKGPDVDAEQLLLIHRLWKLLGVHKEVRLELNCLGQFEERKNYREALIAYFEAHKEVLDEDANRRLYSNPLRILDTKNPNMQQLVENAPKLMDYLGEESKAFLKKLEDILSANGINYRINPRLVRGLDYYNLTVYEWVTDKLGAQATVCGGGRYDPLVEMLGGRSTPACGFAMGVERVLELMKECSIQRPYQECVAYFCWQGDVYQDVVRMAEMLRDHQIDTIVHSGSAKFANQMKRADASGADYAVILGENELAEGCLTIKPLREHLKDYGSQQTMKLEDAIQYLSTLSINQ